MHLTTRLSLSLICGVAAVSLVVALSEARRSTLALRHSLEMHALALAETLQHSAQPLVKLHANRDLQNLVDRFKDREQLAGVSVYESSGALLASTSGLNQRLSLQDLEETSRGIPRTAEAKYLRSGSRAIHVVTVPLFDGQNIIGTLSVFHDATYIDQQSRSIWRNALTAVLIQTALIAVFAPLMFRLGVKRPLHKVAGWLYELRVGGKAEVPNGHDSGEFELFSTEVTRLASSLVAARAAAENEARLRDLAESDWTPERLRVFVRSQLGGSRLFVVSNCEPYEHRHTSGGIKWSVPASGLVTAVDPVLRACDGTWFAQATGDADREAADWRGRVRVPPDHPQYSLQRIWLTEEEQKGFYSGFSSEGIWPLCSSVHLRPVFRREDWGYYQDVNRKFAEALLREMENEEDPVVLVQDYHFALLPRLIKAQRPDARVAIFWHIPWPNPEAFAICPWQTDLLDGLLGADLIGFQVQAHCNNFLDTVDRALEARTVREHFAVERHGTYTLVRPFPISVDSGRPDEPASRSYGYDRAELLGRHGIRAAYLGVGIDRIDYTKGIPEKFRAVERFLDKNPAYQGEFSFVQIGSPSHTHLPHYQQLTKEIEREAQRINRRFQTDNWRPIVFLNQHHTHQEVQEYYRAADFCMVNSLHDGMNLVSKEFVASREDLGGVLILSRFTGAAHELVDALIVNPYDTEGAAQVIRHALELSPEEGRTRMQRMRAIVRDRNVYWWAGQLIEALCEIRPASAKREPASVLRTASVG